MFNRRKKKPINILDKATDLYVSSSNKKNRMFSNSSSAESQNLSKENFTQGNDFSSSFEQPRFDQLTLSNKVRRELGQRLKSVEDDLNLREDAAQSNLDTLDRGSRYVRKNQKLKKFKV